MSLSCINLTRMLQPPSPGGAAGRATAPRQFGLVQNRSENGEAI